MPSTHPSLGCLFSFFLTRQQDWRATLRKEFRKSPSHNTRHGTSVVSGVAACRPPTLSVFFLSLCASFHSLNGVTKHWRERWEQIARRGRILGIMCNTPTAITQNRRRGKRLKVYAARLRFPGRFPLGFRRSCLQTIVGSRTHVRVEPPLYTRSILPRSWVCAFSRRPCSSCLPAARFLSSQERFLSYQEAWVCAFSRRPCSSCLPAARLLAGTVAEMAQTAPNA